MATSILIDPTVRDIIITDNQVTLTQEPVTAILLTICTPLGSWWGDPLLGSTVKEVAQTPGATPTQIEQAAMIALQRLETLGYCEIQEVVFDANTNVLSIWIDSRPDAVEVNI